jgi:cell division protein FtsB
MFSPLLNIVMQYVGPVFAGIVAGLICKAYFAGQMQSKIRGYQSDIVKSHSKILELEASNDKLEKRIKALEGSFIKDRIFTN